MLNFWLEKPVKCSTVQSWEFLSIKNFLINFSSQFGLKNCRNRNVLFYEENLWTDLPKKILQEQQKTNLLLSIFLQSKLTFYQIGLMLFIIIYMCLLSLLNLILGMKKCFGYFNFRFPENLYAFEWHFVVSELNYRVLELFALRHLNIFLPYYFSCCSVESFIHGFWFFLAKKVKWKFDSYLGE